MVEPSSDVIEAVRALVRVSRVLERACDELSLADYRVLTAIDSGEARASRLAARLALGKPAVSATVESLHRRGLVVRSTVETDNRATALALSAEGDAVLARTEAEMVRRITMLAGSTPDPARVVETLTWLGGAVDAAMLARATTGTSGGLA